MEYINSNRGQDALFMDTQQHNLPHLHVEYQGQKAVISIPDGNLLGVISLPRSWEDNRGQTTVIRPNH